MSGELTYRVYRRRFRTPLRTAWGCWSVREGVLIQLRSGGNVRYGEVAPLPSFGSETLEEALAYLGSLPRQVELSQLRVPDTLPTCQFAIATLLHPTVPVSIPPERICALLPAGAAALAAWPDRWRRGHRCFKWKVGVYAAAQELSWLRQLLAALPPSAQLRLDANAALDQAAAARWLTTCDAYANVEFLEQPLPVDQLPALLDLSRRHRTPLALDESVTTLAQLRQCYRQGWRGVFVVKVAIAGSVTALADFCCRQSLDVVFSSVFETPVGRSAALKLAERVEHRRALGFGTLGQFADTWDELDHDRLWQQLV